MNSNYQKYRGKCKEFSEELCRENSDLTLVRGFYHCPIWGKQAHWWCKDKDGNIVDPTKLQFPSGGIIEFYEEFDGNVECSNCGKSMKEEDVSFAEGKYAFCSGECYGIFIGVI